MHQCVEFHYKYLTIFGGNMMMCFIIGRFCLQIVSQVYIFSGDKTNR